LEIALKSKISLYSDTVNITSDTSTNIKSSIINIGNIIGDLTYINIGETDSTVLMQGNNITIGDDTSTNVTIEGNNINLGNATLFSTIKIGNELATVYIKSLSTSAIGVGNFFDQFA